MGRTRARNRINEETVCADCLVHDLKARCRCQHVEAKSNRPDDPPDFWVDVDGVRFAAEVTSIVIGHAYQADSQMLRREVLQAAREQRVLSGTYALLFRRYPELPKQPSGARRALVADATSFIRETRHVDSAADLYLIQVPNGELSICKLSSRGATVGALGPTDVKWEGEVRDELQCLMQTAVTQKRAKLEKKGVPSICPSAILLLYDAYGYADPDDAGKALLRTNGYDWFHSVFWAASFTDRRNELDPNEPGRNGAFLYSRHERWLEGAAE